MEMVTLVTQLFDLQKLEQIPRRSIDIYKKEGENLLKVQLPLVIYCQQDLIGWIWTKRKEYGLESKTKIIAQEPESFHRLARIRRDYKGFDSRQTPLYVGLNWNKITCLEATSITNPFKSDYFIWIDFGLTHVMNFYKIRPLEELVQFLPQYPDKIHCTLGHPHSEAQVELYNGGIAGGCFGGSQKAVLQLCDLFWIEVETAIASGYIRLEEPYLGKLAWHYPELFKVWTGHLKAIYVNWGKIRIWDPECLLILSKLKDRVKGEGDSNYKVGILHAQQILEAYREGIAPLTPTQVVDVYVNLYLCQWYVDGDLERRVRECRQVGEQVHNFILEKGKEAFDPQYYEQVESVFAFSNIELP